MTCFKFEITELLSRVVEVSASDEDEAYEKISKMYANEDIVLSADDFSHVTIHEYNPERKD